MIYGNPNHRFQLLIAVGFSITMVLAYFTFAVNVDAKSTYGNLEKSLCSVAPKRETYSQEPQELQDCPKSVVTVEEGGRMSNKIWEYAAVWAVAKETGLEPYVPTCIYDAVEKMYDNLSVKPIKSIAICPFRKATFTTCKFKNWRQSTENLILPKHSVEIETVLLHREDFRKEFIMKEHLVIESQKQLREIQAPPGTIYVGMHVRKTDYSPYVQQRFNVKPAGFSFYEKAMQTFDKKYQNVIFVIVSDNPYWCYEHLSYRGNVYVIGGKGANSAEVDLAILSSCNHSIIDYGAYACWGALMAGGDTIYYNLTGHYTARVGQILKNWRTL